MKKSVVIGRLFRVLCLSTAAYGSVTCARAAITNKTWTGAGTDFNTAANWSPAVVPFSGDAIIFSNSVAAQPNISSSITVDSLTFASNAANYRLTSATPSTRLTLGNAWRVLNVNYPAGITNTIDAPIILGAAAGMTNQLNMLGGGGTLILNGVISEANSGVSLLLTAGPATLTATNTYSGDTLINGSGAWAIISSLGNAGVSGNLGRGAAIHIYGGLRYAGAGETSSKVIDLYASGVSRVAIIDTTGASGGLVFTSDLLASAAGPGNYTLTLTGDSTGNAFQGKIIDGAQLTALIKDGPGTWVLSGANTFSGGSQLRAGAMIIGNKAAFGTGKVDIHGDMNLSVSNDLSGANAITNTMILTSGSSTFTGTNNIEFSGTVTNMLSVQSITDNLSAGNLIFSGNVFLSDANNAARTITFTGSGATVISGNIANNSGANTNACAITYTGTGRLTLSGSNTYCGVTTVSSGLLLLNSANALPGGIGASGGISRLTLNGGVLGLGNGDFSRGLGSASNQVQFLTTAGGGFAAYGANRVVNLGGASASATWNTGGFVITGAPLLLGAASADHTVDFQNPIQLATAVRTVQVDDGSATVDARMSGALTGTGVSGLTKTGLGTLELMAANTYAGLTTINAGRVLINGATSGQSNYVVNAGGTLGGTGTVGLVSGRTVSINAGGAIAPGGPGIGTLNVSGGFLLGENARYDWEFKDGTGDRVAITGDLHLPSVATVTVTQVSGTLPKPATLFTAGSLSGATDLSGWVISGHYAAKTSGTSVILVAQFPGTVVELR